jgi:hypothetical protein
MFYYIWTFVGQNDRIHPEKPPSINKRVAMGQRGVKIVF